jgi:methylated-DNA-[protein]-cysteine S-methyltransferase
MDRRYYSVRAPLGEILIKTEADIPTGIILPGSGIKGAVSLKGAPPAVRETGRRLIDYFNGKSTDGAFASVLLEGIQTSEFSRKVLEAVAAIPWGSTASYGEVAAMAGSPGAARAVGGVMRSNPFPILIPCHRVVRSDGTLGGFSCGTETKEWLLAFEGTERPDPESVG